MSSAFNRSGELLRNHNDDLSDDDDDELLDIDYASDNILMLSASAVPFDVTPDENDETDDENDDDVEFSTEHYLQCKKQGFGKEKLQLYKLLIFGPPGVGKSSLFQVLVGENLSDVRNSTGVLNVVQVQVKIAITKHSSWHLFSRKEEIARLRDVIKKQFKDHYKWNTCFTEQDDTLMSVERTIVQDTTSISDKYAETILICYDSGGHLEFFDIMPALSTLPTGNIMVFDMKKGLGSCTVDGFYIDGECHSSQGQDQFDCTTLLQTAVANIQSLTKRKVSNASATSSRNLLVVGTHLDKCDEKQKTLKCLDKKFYEDVLSKDTRMVKTRQRGQNSLIIHPISNTDASTERDKIAQEIRTAIEEMSKDEIDYSEIQVGWHLFQLEIQETQKNYIGRSEYLHIARSCNMSEDDTSKALQFFHELGILFYYEAAVDVVFCYPQWLFDRLTDLIVQKYRPNSYDIEENMKKGKFSIQDLDTIYKEHIYHDGPLKLEDLLNIFVHHNIMACLPNSNEYFMPALLKPSPASFSLSQLCGKQIGSTLFVQSENTYVPRGVFCCLVVNLAREDWLVNENNSYKDLIIFQNASNQQVVLFDKIKYIGLKMYVKEDKTLKTNHFDIYKTFDLKLKIICSQMRIDWNFKVGFPCKNPDCSDIVCIDFRFPWSVETKCNNCFKRNSLDYDHLVWLFPPHFTDRLGLQPLPISHEQQVQSVQQDCRDARARIESNWAELTTLQINHLLEVLCKMKGITSHEKQTIENIPTNNGKMGYFLDRVLLTSLKLGIITKFNVFVKTLEKYDKSDVAKKLVHINDDGDQPLLTIHNGLPPLDPEIRKIIVEAKGKGLAIEVRHAKVMVCGSSAAGKTNFINLLLEDEFVSTHRATVVTASKDTMIKEIMVSESNESQVKFNKCDLKHQIDFLKSHLCHKQFIKSAVNSGSVSVPLLKSASSAGISGPSSIQEASEDIAINENVVLNKDIERHESFKSTKDDKDDLEHGISNANSPVSHSIRGRPKKVTPHRYESYVEKELTSTPKDMERLPKTWDMLTFLDTGGQPEYISMLPAVNSSVMVTFIVLSLEYELSQNVAVFKGDNVKQNNMYMLPYNYISLIKMLLSMRKPQKVNIPDDVLSNEGKISSFLSFIGTKSDIIKADLDKKLDDVVDNINKELQNIVKEVVCVADMLRFDGGNYLTAVSNCNAGRTNEDYNAKKIRSKLYEILKDIAPVYHIPIPWLLLELEIKYWCEKNERSYMKLIEVQDLCTNFRFLDSNEEYIKKFLKFYHILGVFLYYDIDGHDIVITNVQWFYNNLSKLVTFATINEKRDDYDYLLNIGLINNRIFEEMKFDKTEYLTTDYFSKVFQSLGIMAVYAQSDKEAYYFSPVILRTCDLDIDKVEVLLNRYGNSFKVEPLLLQISEAERFEMQFLPISYCGFPRGSYCCLAVHLVQKQNTIKFGGQLNLLLSPECLYSDLIIFQYFPNNVYDDDQEYYVILLDRYTYLEISVRCNKKPVKNTVYFQIKDLIYHSLKTVLRNLHFGVDNIRIAFRCSKCKHLADNSLKGVQQKERFYCRQCKIGYSYSTSVWLQDCFAQADDSESGIIKTVPVYHKAKKPTYSILVKYLTQIPEWKYVAAFLLPNDVDGSTLEIIEKNYRYSINDCWLAVIRKFFKNSDVSWHNVLEALRNAGYNTLASEIVEDQGLPKVIVDPPSQSVDITQTVKFTTKVSGVGKENFNYQWRHNKEDINGETSNTLTIVDVTEDHSGTYECVVKNTCGNIDISTAKLKTRPTIITQPSSKEVTSSTKRLSLTCQAIGATSYKWEKQDGSISSGAIGVSANTLAIVNLTPEDAGSYRCVLSNDSDKSYSKYAIITIKDSTLLHGDQLSMSQNTPKNSMKRKRKRSYSSSDSAPSSSHKRAESRRKDESDPSRRCKYKKHKKHRHKKRKDDSDSPRSYKYKKHTKHWHKKREEDSDSSRRHKYKKHKKHRRKKRKEDLDSSRRHRYKKHRHKKDYTSRKSRKSLKRRHKSPAYSTGSSTPPRKRRRHS